MTDKLTFCGNHPVLGQSPMIEWEGDTSAISTAKAYGCDDVRLYRNNRFVRVVWSLNFDADAAKALFDSTLPKTSFIAVGRYHFWDMKDNTTIPRMIVFRNDLSLIHI